MTKEEQSFLERAIELSRQGMMSGRGGPFGCVVVRNGTIIGEGCNEVTTSLDPTAHAEVVAIRNACPMCLGAIYWARPRRVIYANTKADAAAIDFDDQFIYDEIEKEDGQRRIEFIHEPHEAALKVFTEWKKMDNKTIY